MEDNTIKNMSSRNDTVLLDCREVLIDVEIERAVSRMQSVIELGRVIRDRKTLPSKVWCLSLCDI